MRALENKMISVSHTNRSDIPSCKGHANRYVDKKTILLGGYIINELISTRVQEQ